jgi:hypothetical protein
MSIYIVYGPQACGKTRNKHAIAKHLGCDIIVDEWDESRPLTEGAVHLALKNPASMFGVTAVSFDDVMKGVTNESL